MGQRKYPPPTPDEIIAILIARGFIFHHSGGDHRYYVHTVKGKKRIAQIDMGNPLYADDWLKLLIQETGMTREQFYCSTKSSARKINLSRAAAELAELRAELAKAQRHADRWRAFAEKQNAALLAIINAEV